MFKKLIKFFKGPTPEEAYQNGRRCVIERLEKVADKEAESLHLFLMAAGGFNTTAAHREFDRGVVDQLITLGYKDPF